MVIGQLCHVFLDATQHLCKRVCPSVHPSFHVLDAFSHLYKRVCPSVGPAFVELRISVLFFALDGFIECWKVLGCIVGSINLVISESIEKPPNWVWSNPGRERIDCTCFFLFSSLMSFIHISNVYSQQQSQIIINISLLILLIFFKVFTLFSFNFINS